MIDINFILLLTFGIAAIIIDSNNDNRPMGD